MKKTLLVVSISILCGSMAFANERFHYKYIPCGEGYDLCLQMNFHCNRSNFKKVANMTIVVGTTCSFKGYLDSGEDIFVSSKDCTTIDKEEWKLEVSKERSDIYFTLFSLLNSSFPEPR